MRLSRWTFCVRLGKYVKDSFLFVNTSGDIFVIISVLRHLARALFEEADGNRHHVIIFAVGYLERVDDAEDNPEDGHDEYGDEADKDEHKDAADDAGDEVPDEPGYL